MYRMLKSATYKILEKKSVMYKYKCITLNLCAGEYNSEMFFVSSWSVPLAIVSLKVMLVELAGM